MVYADAVIVGRMQRYRERIGDEWGAKSPASVAFVLDLIDVRRGDVIWTARFDETQKPSEREYFCAWPNRATRHQMVKCRTAYPRRCEKSGW